MTQRILFVTRVPGLGGGSEKHLVDLVRRLDTSAVSPTILCYGVDAFSEAFDRDTAARVDVVKERPPMRLRTLGFWRSFVRYRPTTIVFVNGHLAMLPPAAYVAARLTGARLLTILHKDPHDPRPRRPGDAALRFQRLRRLKRAIVRPVPRLLCHTTICVSRAIRATLVSDFGYREDRTIAVPNGVDLTYYRRNGGPSDDIRASLNLGHAEPLLVCVARLVGDKGIDVLLKAFATVHAQRPSAVCLIAGDGPLHGELRALSESLGVAKAVSFLGHVDDVRPYLGASDIFVLASRWEGLPLVLLEAMACGLPCVATDLAGNRELVVQGETGLIVKSGSPEDLAEGVLYLAEHRRERDRMGVNARQRVEDCFDIEKAMTTIQSVIVG